MNTRFPNDPAIWICPVDVAPPMLVDAADNELSSCPVFVEPETTTWPAAEMDSLDCPSVNEDSCGGLLTNPPASLWLDCPELVEPLIFNTPDALADC